MNSTYKGSIELLRNYWEDRSVSFERDYGIRQRGIVKLASQIRKLLDSKKILELGCGPGIVASYYPQTADTVGLDFSALMLKRAKKRIQKLVQGDALTLPFCAGVFEVVTCFFMASDYAAKQNIFAEAFRVLEKGGLFLYADYSLDDEHWKLRRTIRPALGENCDINIEEERELSDKLSKIGFTPHTAKPIRFIAEFRLERYVKSRNEMQKLKEDSPKLWKTLKTHMDNGTINREFILLINRK